MLMLQGQRIKTAVYRDAHPLIAPRLPAYPAQGGSAEYDNLFQLKRTAVLFSSVCLSF